jgi:hypothetical protein
VIHGMSFDVTVAVKRCVTAVVTMVVASAICLHVGNVAHAWH